MRFARAVQVVNVSTAMPIFSVPRASVFRVSQMRLSCQSLKKRVSQASKSCLRDNVSPACRKRRCLSFLWSHSGRGARTKSGSGTHVPEMPEEKQNVGHRHQTVVVEVGRTRGAQLKGFFAIRTVVAVGVDQQGIGS